MGSFAVTKISNFRPPEVKTDIGNLKKQVLSAKMDEVDQKLKKEGVYGLLKAAELSNEAVYLANTEQQPNVLKSLVDDLKEAAKVSSPGDANDLENAVQYVKKVIK